MQTDLQRHAASRRLYRTASKFITGGVHSGFRYRTPHPIYFKKARGPKVWDVDGNEYTDFIVNMGACVLGHRHPRVVGAVREQLRSGLTVGLESPLSVEVSRQLHRMIPSAEVVKFSNTGTEAVMHAIQIARGYTGRQKLIKVEGCYDGWLDEMQVSVHPDVTGASTTVPHPESRGLSEDVASRVRVVPYNDTTTLAKLLRSESGGFAALIVEPVMFNSGCVLPAEGYLRELRRITEDNDVLLIFDEVITGFRMAPGGAQEYYRVTPDISVFGKALANGFPLSAVVGRREVMDVTSPGGGVVYAGTYNGSQPSLAAARASLKELEDGSAQRRLHAMGSDLAKRFNRLAADLSVSAQMIATGGQFQVYFTAEEVTDYRSAGRSDASKYGRFVSSLLSSGCLLSPFYLFHHGVSLAHTRRELDAFLAASESALDLVGH